MSTAYLYLAYLGGLDIVSKSIVSGQTTSLDNTSSGLLSVMQELSRRSNRREPSKGVPTATEVDWAKKIINYGPYGKC